MADPAAFDSHARDTRHEAERVRIAIIRGRSMEARLQDAIELSELVHGAAMARLRARSPTLSKLQLALELNGLSPGSSTVKP